MQYKVTVRPLGKPDIDLGLCRVSLTKDGSLLIMDEDGIDIRYSAQRCRVECMARKVVIISGVTDAPEFVEFFCIYPEGRQ
jgi:hypothetical protein